MKCLPQVPILEMTTTNAESDSDGQSRELTKKKRLSFKSGKLKTANSMVIHRFTWPQELIYIVLGQPSVYHEPSIALFISGYLTVMNLEKQSLRPLMACHIIRSHGRCQVVLLGVYPRVPYRVAPTGGKWSGQVE